MEPILTIQRLEQSEIFMKFKEQQDDYYLAHAFSMFQSLNSKPEWQIGYYSKKEDKIVSFETNPFSILPAQEVFKKSDSIPLLDLKVVDVPFTKALDICNSLMQEKNSAEQITRIILLLQTINDVPTYNITFVTSSLSMLLFKIDAITGKLISNEKKSLMDLGSMAK